MRYRPIFSEILFIDADNSLVRSMTILLQSVGYIVRSAPDVETGRLLINKKKPELIWLSVEASREDNHQFIREMKSKVDLRVIPILICYDTNDIETASACLNAGADELISRPIDHTVLLLRIRVLLRLKATSADLVNLTNHLEEKVIERTAQLEKANVRLRNSEKLSSLGRLASSIVHEINNPITGMMLNIGLMEESLPQDSKLLLNLKVFNQSLDQITGLLQQLRTFSKPAETICEMVSINRIFHQIGNLLEKQLRKDKITVRLDLDKKIPDLWLPEDQIREAVLNLAVNAADAMPDGGTLSISTRRNDDRIELSISDTGEGIATELLDRIFEPFFTTKGEKGTGMGLAITYNIIQTLNGDISVESQVGLGTRIVISLPVTENHDEVQSSKENSRVY